MVILLHPRVFTAIARVIFRRFGAPEPPPLPYRILLGPRLLRVHLARRRNCSLPSAAFTDADPGLEMIPYLGGAAAVGAIVAVLTVFAPSGLGVREASMYGLLVVVVPAGAALGATVLNRLAITLVEAALLGGAFS